MRIVTEPTVTVMGRLLFRPHPDPSLQIPGDWMGHKGGDYEALGAFFAKGCYDSFGGSGRSCGENQREVIAQRHGSVLEHLVIPVYVTGITRACSLELNRHRPLAISQRSTRYTEEEDAAIVLEPYYAELHKLRPNPPGVSSRREDGRYESQVYADLEFIAQHVHHAEAALLRYAEEVEWLMARNPLGLTDKKELRKWARGKARNILPHALETRVGYTGNIRAWRWVIEARSSRHAEDEVRRLAHHLFVALSAEAPLYFKDYTAEMVRGIPEYTTEYRKV